MSYILDALRRADAERQQGHVPGLHAAPAAELAPAKGRRWARWLGLLALGLLLAAVAVVLTWRAQPPSVAVATPPVAAPAPAMPVTPAPALPVVVSAAPMQVPEVARAAQPLPTASASTVAAATTATQPVPPPKPAAVRAVPLSSLPPDERRQLPALTPGGSVWSDSAASRFVILDGQVLREGDTVAPGVVLERIERKAAVLRLKDQRVEVPL